MKRLNSQQVLRLFCLMLVGLGGAFMNAACSRVLSERTDEQAWNEFDQESQVNARTPASAEALKISAETYKILKDRLSEIPVRTLLLKCASLEAPENCYQAALVLQFDERFRKSQAEIPELKKLNYRKEQAAFLALRSFAQVSEEVRRFHQSILSGLDLKAREHAEDLFHLCENEKESSATIESFAVFHPLSELPKGVYACLVKNWNGDEDLLLDGTAERLGLKITSLEAKNWIKKELISIVYENELNELLQKRSKEEFARFSNLKKDFFQGFDLRAPEGEMIKKWSPKLREQFLYSPVEQWVVTYRTEAPHQMPSF